MPANNAALSLAIIEDNRLVRGALTSMLSQLADVQVVAAPIADTTSLAKSKPNVILLDAGLRDQDAARRLDISVYAVRSHVCNIMEKLALYTRLQIAAYSRR